MVPELRGKWKLLFAQRFCQPGSSKEVLRAAGRASQHLWVSKAVPKAPRSESCCCAAGEAVLTSITPIVLDSMESKLSFGDDKSGLKWQLPRGSLGALQEQSGAGSAVLGKAGSAPSARCALFLLSPPFLSSRALLNPRGLFVCLFFLLCVCGAL